MVLLIEEVNDEIIEELRETWAAEMKTPEKSTEHWKMFFWSGWMKESKKKKCRKVRLLNLWQNTVAILCRVKKIEENPRLKDLCPEKKMTNHGVRKTVAKKLKSFNVPRREITNITATHHESQITNITITQYHKSRISRPPKVSPTKTRETSGENNK